VKRATKLALVAIGALTAALYGAVALSSVPRAIARNSPENASLFRPVWFNFSAKYQDGSVLGFQTGFSRDQFSEAVVKTYGASAELQVECGREEGAPPLTVAESSVAGSDVVRVGDLAQRPVVCLYLTARRIMLIFKFSDDHIKQIDLSFTRNEIAT
jgi:hypothetical protein